MFLSPNKQAERFFFCQFDLLFKSHVLLKLRQSAIKLMSVFAGLTLFAHNFVIKLN